MMSKWKSTEVTGAPMTEDYDPPKYQRASLARSGRSRKGINKRERAPAACMSRFTVKARVLSDLLLVGDMT
jgi:hypothetical protein